MFAGCADTRGRDFIDYFFGPCNIAECSGDADAPVDWLPIQLMFGVAYHKHSPLCGRPDFGRINFGTEWPRCGARDLAVAESQAQGNEGVDVPKDNCGQFAVADAAQEDPKCVYAANGRLPYFAFFASWPYGNYKGSIPDALPVFDINFVNDINHCNGSVCRNAAAAVDDRTNSLT